jgi:hypothetical protein
VALAPSKAHAFDDSAALITHVHENHAPFGSQLCNRNPTFPNNERLLAHDTSEVTRGRLDPVGSAGNRDYMAASVLIEPKRKQGAFFAVRGDECDPPSGGSDSLAGVVEEFESATPYGMPAAHAHNLRNRCARIPDRMESGAGGDHSIVGECHFDFRIPIRWDWPIARLALQNEIR